MATDASLKVQGVTAYPEVVASARVRVANYVSHLAAEGVCLRYRSALTDDDYRTLAAAAAPSAKARVLARSALRGLSLGRDEGLLLVHRLLLLAPLPGIDPPRRLDAYDFDDALDVGSAAQTNRRFQWLKQEARRAERCLRRARLVIAANPTLATQASRFARRVEVIPSCVDPSRQPLREHRDDHSRLTIGWIGSHTTAQYLEPVLPLVSGLSGAGLRVRLLVVGADTGVREPWIEHRPWSLDRQEADIAEMDIGIMPLPDDPWTRGKSGYKLLQYFAAGVPAVASPVGVNVELLGDGRGIVAQTDTEWRDALTELLSEADSRRQRGLIARRYVEQNFSYARWAPELADLLRSLA